MNDCAACVAYIHLSARSLRTEHLYTSLPDARATPGDDCDFVSIPHACISHGLFMIAGHMWSVRWLLIIESRVDNYYKHMRRRCTIFYVYFLIYKKKYLISIIALHINNFEVLISENKTLHRITCSMNLMMQLLLSCKNCVSAYFFSSNFFFKWIKLKLIYLFKI